MIDDIRPLAFSYVRFSSEAQARGSSLARQTEAAQRWADENGYQLSATTFRDLGVSAFKGDNSSIGRLAAFLEAVENGVVPKGAALLVENLDRVSRQNHRKATRVLEDILEAGIDVVTLQDGKRYTLKDLDEDPLTSIMIILSFARAHDESLTKSKRVKDGWQRNLAKVRDGTRLRSSTVPSWLKLVGTMDDGHLELVPEKVSMVQELYQRFADGQSVNSIAKGFRERGIPTLRDRAFTSGNIYRIVKSKAPYGILEVGRGTNNDRTVFDQIEGYFPRIVDEEVQRRVTFRLQNMRQKTAAIEAATNASAATSPKRRTNGILTGVIWSHEKAGGGRCVCRKSSDGTYAYVDNLTRRWVAKREVLERPFLEGWSEVVMAYETDTTPEIEDAEAALLTAETTLEFAEGKGSERLILAAQADVEEAQRNLKELRKGQALAMQEVPTDLSEMEPWEANQVVRRVIERIDVVRGDARQQRVEGGDGRLGKQVMLDVKLRNGVRLYFGDLELLFG
ncbi:recombinase family protein [Yoonia sp.]|nr:recombinase family protein [Yoonia sp.]MDC1399535.1 recombinase family protein [Yoonia sp.]